MKHPDSASESYEFNLGKAGELRCSQQEGSTTCGICESCLIVLRYNDVKEWFFRAGDHTRKHFILGFLGRTHSPGILQNIVRLLQPMVGKDFTYSRTRTNPGLAEDRSTASMDRALDSHMIDLKISETWAWYHNANYWSKSKFLMMMLSLCEPHLLHDVAVQTKVQLVAEENTITPLGKIPFKLVSTNNPLFLINQ